MIADTGRQFMSGSNWKLLFYDLMPFLTGIIKFRKVQISPL